MSNLSLELDLLAAKLDAKGQGVACGGGWISPRAKCSKDKAKTTSKENLAKTTERRKKMHGLKAEVAADKGKKAKDKVTPDWDKKLEKLENIGGKTTGPLPKTGSKEWDALSIKERDQEAAELDRLAGPPQGIKPITQGVKGRTVAAINKEIKGSGLSVSKSEYGPTIKLLDKEGRMVGKGSIANMQKYLNDPTSLPNRQSYSWVTPIGEISDLAHAVELSGDAYYKPESPLGRKETFGPTGTFSYQQALDPKSRITRNQARAALATYKAKDGKVLRHTKAWWGDDEDESISKQDEAVIQKIAKHHPDLIEASSPIGKVAGVSGGEDKPSLKALEGGEKSLKDLFAEADRIGSKYQEPGEPVSISAKRAANRILKESGYGQVSDIASGKVRRIPDRSKAPLKARERPTSVRGVSIDSLLLDLELLKYSRV